MAEQRVERRLAAILAADVAGYSLLMGVDEEGTLARLNAHRRDEPTVAEYRGRIVKRTGDGILVEFGSAVDATRCAIQTQRGMAQRNADVPPDQRIEIRIGIHVGDIIIEEGDIFGDGVNIAARLEGIAERGGISISDDTFRQVRGKLDVAFDDAGEQQLKNIEQPVRVYRIQLGATAVKGAALAPSDRPSIAVLPFQNMSDDPAQEYFVDGIVEDIITGLSRTRWLFVIARNSTFTYKGRAVDVKQAGRELGVRYVLEGSLRRAGDRVRITCQLIETASGTHVWAERYDRPLGDIFALQDEITLSVVSAIEPSLRQAEIVRAKRKRPENLDAYDLYLRALPHAQVAMPGDGEKALEWLHKSLALEPDYAAAHALAAWCYEQRYLRGGMHEADKIAGLYHARAALGSGADDPTTLATAGFVIGLVEHDYQTAMNAIDHALALSGSSTLALSLGATILAHDGQITRAIEYGERALRLSPHDPTVYLQLTALGIAHLAAGRFEDAAAVCNKACQSNPHFSFPAVLQTAALSSLGRVNEAKALARRVLELQPRFSVAQFVRSHTGRAEIWKPIGDALRHVGLPE
jgi:TolB-like protein/Flp pilus assembly protein TadD